MLDAYYTPPQLALAMAHVGLKRMPQPRAMIDIACGTGALLAAIADRTPTTQVLGFDLDKSIVAALVIDKPSWSISNADALSAASRSQSPISALWGQIDLAVLNPPFSCRGQRTLMVNVNGLDIRCSPHMAFVLVSIEALRSGGRLVAILPASAHTLMRDKRAWSIVDHACTTAISHRFPRGSFPRVSAATELHVIDKLHGMKDTIEDTSIESDACCCERPVRGWLQMHSLTRDSSGIHLVHTSNLVDGKIDIDFSLRVLTSRSLAGPAVLLPRVGKPDPHKVVVHHGEPIALSDCVFGVPCMSKEDAESLRYRIVESWHRFELRYGGSCAPHLTLSMLRAALCEINR